MHQASRYPSALRSNSAVALYDLRSLYHGRAVPRGTLSDCASSAYQETFGGSVKAQCCQLLEDIVAWRYHSRLSDRDDRRTCGI